jgi:hypothetical protein
MRLILGIVQSPYQWTLTAESATSGLVSQLSPRVCADLDIESFGRSLDSLPGLIPLPIADPFDLVETSDGVPHMTSIGEGFLPFLRKGELLVGQLILLSG